MLWRKNGKLLRGADGKITRCDDCPCEPPSCCTDGIAIPDIYVWGYMSAYGGNSQLINRCLPSVCAALTANGAYVSYGLWSAGTFDFNMGNFSQIGTIGCANVRFIETCVPGQGGASGANQAVLTVDFDLGAGYIGAQSINIVSTFTGPAPGSFECVLELGGFAYSEGDSTDPQDIDVYLTTRDPATGILTDDGAATVVPTVFTLSVTLLDATGTPTLYQCDMVFAPTATNVFGKQFGWLGWLDDCTSGSCSRISLWFDEGSGLWTITATTHAAGNVTIYSGTAFPTAGMATGVWPDCGGGTTTNAMWST